MARITIKKHQGTLPKLTISFLKRFHLLLFFVVVVGLLAAAVVLINKTLIDSSSQSYRSTIDAGTIDQATLERIQSLHTSDQPTSPSLPSSERINPFAE